MSTYYLEVEPKYLLLLQLGGLSDENYSNKIGKTIFFESSLMEL